MSKPKKESANSPDLAKKIPADRKEETAAGNKKPADGEKAIMEANKKPDNRECVFINRELSWLEFNHRVLEESYDHTNPLLERLKFLAITASNLDEFFMVRVSSLVDQIAAGFGKADPSGIDPITQLRLVLEKTHTMVEKQYNCLNKSLIPFLKKEKIIFRKMDSFSENELDFINNYYKNTLFPVLTPMRVDSSRPFPLILNKSLNIGLLLKNFESDTEKPVFATVQVPSVIDRLVRLPSDKNVLEYVLLEDIIKYYIGDLFKGHEIISMSCFRITRNTDQGLDEEGAEDLLEAIEAFIKNRKWGEAIRLEIEKGMDQNLLSVLKDELEIGGNSVFIITGPLDLTFLMKISSDEKLIYLKYKSFSPQLPVEFKNQDNLYDIFDIINNNDILLHHPYDSFEPVVRLVEAAAKDPGVLAIKQTLYRVSGNSPIIEALALAAENGKQVTVLVELKARFDEQNNVIWAKRLEKSGCHVIYGLVGLKTHCKALLIVRKEENGIKRYVHLGTGNYNDVTARLYTDIGLFTVNPYIGADISNLFNLLSGHSQPSRMYKTEIAPVGLRNKFISLIRQEALNAAEGKKAVIIAKLNSLVDEQIINELYEASCKGVTIELIVRGVCCLKPGVKGVSANITVRSIVGRFLEHSRIYYFYNNGDELYYLSSADWMGRNLDRRVELLFPIEDRSLCLRLMEIINISLKDTEKARIMNTDGTYSGIDRRGRVKINSQEFFCSMAIKSSNDFRQLRNYDSVAKSHFQ